MAAMAAPREKPMARKARRAPTTDELRLDAPWEALREAPRARRRRLKSRAADRRVKEVDRNTSLARLERAAKRLKSAHASERVLSVPQWNMDKAVEAMKRAGVSGVVTNLCGTRKQRVETKQRAEKRKPALVSV